MSGTKRSINTETSNKPTGGDANFLQVRYESPTASQSYEAIVLEAAVNVLFSASESKGAHDLQIFAMFFRALSARRHADMCIHERVSEGGSS